MLGVILCIGIPILGNDHDDVYLFSLDYLYPQTYFYRFEASSKELWSDLDLLLAHKESLELAINNNYLKTQFQKVHAAAHMLCAHKNEARNYLPDDIEYLIEIVNLLTEKSVTIIDTVADTHSNLAAEVLKLLQETKTVLECLLMENEEVVLC